MQAEQDEGGQRPPYWVLVLDVLVLDHPNEPLHVGGRIQSQAECLQSANLGGCFVRGTTLALNGLTKPGAALNESSRGFLLRLPVGFEDYSAG